MSGRAIAAALCVVGLGAAGLSGCDRYDRPNVPVPSSFSASTLDGRTLRASDLKGKPWVVNLWVPG